MGVDIAWLRLDCETRIKHGGLTDRSHVNPAATVDYDQITIKIRYKTNPWQKIAGDTAI